jgi:hypothetical protein
LESTGTSLAKKQSEEERAIELYQFLRDYQNVYEEVINHCKDVELEKGNFPSFSVLETRGIVYHLFKATAEDQDTGVQIIEAKSHLIRCCLDVATVLITLYIQDARKIRDKYKETTIKNVLSNYSDVMQLLNSGVEALNMMSTKRDDQNAFFQNNIQRIWGLIAMVKEARNKVVSLDAEYQRIESEEETEALAAEQRAKNEMEAKSKLDDNRMLKNRGIAFVLGIIAAAIGLGIKMYFFP